MPTESPAGGKPDCVVVDTSIWRANPLLRGPTGVALVYTLSRQGGRIGLPEVVESELRKQIIQVGREARLKVQDGARVLALLSDNYFFDDTPADELLGSYVDTRLEELSPLLHREPFTLQHAKAALEMVNAEVPPNGKNQQFKDSAIWHACLSIATRYTTHFVTGDKAFFADREPKNGLAPNLIADCRAACVQIRPHSDLASCLKAITVDQPPIDEARVSELVRSAVMDELKTQAEKHRFEVREVLETGIKPFRTEQPGRIAIDYRLCAKIVDEPSLTPSTRDDARGIVHGSAYYFPHTGLLEGHLIQQVALRYKSGSVVRSFREYDAATLIPRPLEGE